MSPRMGNGMDVAADGTFLLGSLDLAVSWFSGRSAPSGGVTWYRRLHHAKGI
jgi:hypothetical protein